jgi:NAD dependent epimerase/dehydratase family enzyme
MGTDPALALTGRRCVPRRLLDEGFTFRLPRLADAVSDLVGDRSPSPEPC